MTYTLRPLSLGTLLDETFDIYRHNFLLFLGISAVPNIALLLVRLSIGTLRGGDWEGLAALGGLGASIAALFVGAIVTAATTFAVSDIYLDRPTTIRACFSRVSGKTLSVAYVTFATGLIVGFGILLLIAPGIYWAGRYGVAIPAVVLEDVDGGQSLKRSAELTRGYVGRVIVVYFLTAIFSLIMATALTAGVNQFGSGIFHTGMLTKAALEQIMAALSGILFGPISAIGLTLAYYDLRMRKEAFDIEHMMSLLSAPQRMAAEATGS